MVPQTDTGKGLGAGWTHTVSILIGRSENLASSLQDYKSQTQLYYKLQTRWNKLLKEDSAFLSII